MISVMRLVQGTALWQELICYAQSCSWEAGKHLAHIMRDSQFRDWESVFAALDGGRIAGFCTLLNTDFYPDNRYSPWISTIFVGEEYRGRRISRRMIEAAIDYARSQGFARVYIPSNITGLYEKYSFEKTSLRITRAMWTAYLRATYKKTAAANRLRRFQLLYIIQRRE